MTDEVAAAVKLLAVEQELVFADEQDYQHAIALGVAAYQAARKEGWKLASGEFRRGFEAGEVNAGLLNSEYQCFPIDAKVDVIFPDGEHRYWSTHCRHATDKAGHEACKATELAPGVPRNPGQCKTCAAPCLCHCHLARALDLDDQEALANEVADYQRYNDQHNRNGS